MKVLTACINLLSLFQMIIAGSWVFSLIFNIPLFLVMDIRKKKNRTYCGEIFPERWMAMAYSLAWLFLIVLSLVMMVVLYSRVVYTLWFKQDDDNQPTSQQRVSIPYQYDLTWWSIFSYIGVYLYGITHYCFQCNCTKWDIVKFKWMTGNADNQYFREI